MPTEDELTRKFLSDESFRDQFKKDPKATMRAHGVYVPEGVEIEVVESTARRHYIVMPPLETAELSEEEISGVQGGLGLSDFSCFKTCGIPGGP